MVRHAGTAADQIQFDQWMREETSKLPLGTLAGSAWAGVSDHDCCKGEVFFSSRADLPRWMIEGLKGDLEARFAEIGLTNETPSFYLQVYEEV